MPDKMFAAFHTEPGEHECWQVCWSNCRSCKSCPFSECYRAGWDKAQVEADNKAIVERKMRERMRK